MALIRPQFRTIHMLLSVSSLLSEKPQRGWKLKAFNAYKVATTVISAYGIVSMVHAVLNMADSVQLPYCIGMAFVHLLGVLSSLFFFLREQEVRKVLEDVAQLYEQFSEDTLQFRFVERSSTFDLKVQYFIRLRIAVQLIMPALNVASKFFAYHGLLGAAPEIKHFYQPLYDFDFTNHPILYGVELLFQCFVFIFNTLLQCTLECFLILMFLHLTTYFKHLRKSLPKIFFMGVSEPQSRNLTISFVRPRDNVDPTLASFDRMDEIEDLNKLYWLKENLVIEGNLKKWVALHRNALTLGHDLIRLFNPVLLIQFIYIFCILIICSLIFFTQQTLEPVERVLLVVFGTVILSTLYLLCAIGDSVYHHVQSGRVFEPAVSCRWYESSKSVRNGLLIIGERTLTPLRVTVYGSDVFFLGKVTFDWVFRSIISMALALYKISTRRKR